MSSDSPVLLLIGLALCTAIATYVLYRGLRAEWGAGNHANGVNGTILSVDIENRGREGLRPEVTYRFTVSGQEYTGNVIQFGLLGGTWSRA